MRGIYIDQDPEEVWHEEFARLVKVVEDAFRASTRHFELPTEDGCRAVAGYLMALSQQHKNQNKPRGQTKTVEYGNKFLRQIKIERDRIQRLVSFLQQPGLKPVDYWFSRYQRILIQIDEIQRGVDELLPEFSWRPDPDQHRYRKLAAAAREAWRETNNGKAPRSKNFNDPVCRFVVAALAGINENVSPATVSEVLRGRRRIAGGGQKP